MPRRPYISKEDQIALVRRFEDAINEDLSNRMEWVEKRVRSIEDWLNPNPGTKDYPWEGASNITPPLIAKVVRGLHSRLLGSTFNADPWVHVTPVNPQRRESARIREKWLNHQVRNEIPNFYRENNTALLEMIVQGTSFMHPYYERRVSYLPETLTLDRYEVMASGTELERTDQQLLDELFGAEIEATRALGNHTYEVDHTYQGYARTARVVVERDDEMVPLDQVSVRVEREKVRTGVRIRNVSIEDLIFPSNAVSLSEEDSHHVFHVYWRYPNQFRVGGNLTQEDIDKLKMLSKGVGAEQVTFTQDIQNMEEAFDIFQGIEFKNGIRSFDSGRVLCIDCYYPYDMNGDGVDEQLIFTWIPHLRKISDWDYLTSRYRHGRRPFVPFVFIPITGRLYGLGLADILRDVQDEAATIFNQMNDRENLVNNPILLVEQNAGIAASVVRGMPPGTALPVRNVDRIKALEWQKNEHGGIPLLQQLYAFAEQLAGLGDIQVGVQPNRPNAPRTARGTLALISESNIIVDTHVLNVQFISFQELITQIDGLNKQYMPDEYVFQVLGEADPTVITRADMEEEVKFYFSGNTTNTNSQVKQTTAQLLYNLLAQNPLFTGAYAQMPSAAIEAIHHLTEYMVREHTAGKDATHLLPPAQFFVQDAEAIQQAQLQGMQSGKEEAMQANQQAGLQELLMGAQGGQPGPGGPPA